MKVTNRKVVADATLRRWEAERLASIEEAANRWGVSPWTVRYWIHHGKIASHKLGGRRLAPVSEIERLIAESHRILAANGDRLDIDAPDSVLTDDLLATLRAHKAELLDLLADEKPRDA